MAADQLKLSAVKFRVLRLHPVVAGQVVDFDPFNDDLGGAVINWRRQHGHQQNHSKNPAADGGDDLPALV